MELPTKHRLTACLIGFCLMWTMGCSDLPENINRLSSSAVRDGHDTTLGRTFDRQLVNHLDKSGVILLGRGLDAFVGRALLASLAERSIDVQYYMFHQDTVGRLLIDQLIKAADRGVRVRMLIDDIYGDITTASGPIVGTDCAVPQAIAGGEAQLGDRHAPVLAEGDDLASAVGGHADERAAGGLGPQLGLVDHGVVFGD